MLQKMKMRYAAVAGALAGAAISAAPVHAAPMLTLLDSTAPTNAVTIKPGDSFAVTLGLESDVTFQGFSAYLVDPGYTTAARFTITNRTNLATDPFQNGDATTSDSTFTSDPIDNQTRDLGYVGDDAASGTYDIETLQITAAANLPAGQYTIQFDPGSVLVDSDFNGVAFSTMPAPYTVTVAVPEPVTVSLVMLGVMGVGFRRR